MNKIRENWAKRVDQATIYQKLHSEQTSKKRAALRPIGVPRLLFNHWSLFALISIHFHQTEMILQLIEVVGHFCPEQEPRGSQQFQSRRVKEP